MISLTEMEAQLSQSDFDILRGIIISIAAIVPNSEILILLSKSVTAVVLFEKRVIDFVFRRSHMALKFQNWNYDLVKKYLTWIKMWDYDFFIMDQAFEQAVAEDQLGIAS